MQTAEYVRLYTDADGETHFEDVEVPLEPQDFAPPAAPLNVAPFLPATRCVWVGAPPDWHGDEPHPTPQRQVFCGVQGEWAVTTSDGTQRNFGPGSVLLLEDTWGRGHSTRIVGSQDALIFGVVLADAPDQDHATGHLPR